MEIKNIIKWKITKIFILFIFFLSCKSLTFNYGSKKIINILNKNDRDDYFRQYLDKCLPNFYSLVKTSKTNFVEDSVVCVEYVFDNEDKLEKGFSLLDKEVVFIQNLEREDFSELCLSIMDENPIYIKKKKKSLLLFTFVGNIFYKNGKSTIKDFLNSKEGVVIKKVFDKYSSL